MRKGIKIWNDNLEKLVRERKKKKKLSENVTKQI
jgi:hypothetical protein